jgi:putative oxidoreductase
MKILTHISRFLLALIFLIFGLNGFLHFIPMTPPSGVAGQFLGSMFVTKYLLFVFAIQFLGGVLLLINRYVPIALTILGPIILNILFVSARSAFAGIFQARVDLKTAPARRPVGIRSATA